MVTKGIITAIDFNGNTCTVRLPFFETAGNDPIYGTATISNTPGSFNGYKVNDVVWVGFENGQMDTPVILGKLYLGIEKEKSDPRGTINVENSTATKNASIPADTKLSASLDSGMPNTNIPFGSLKSVANSLNSLDSDVGQLAKTTNNKFESIITAVDEQGTNFNSALSQQADLINAKVNKENDGHVTGFGWTINDKGWTVTSHDNAHAGLQDIDIFKVDNGGVTIAGSVKIVGYPTQTLVLYAQNGSTTTPPDFPADNEPLNENFPDTLPAGWSFTEPSRVSGQYIWQKTIVFKYDYNPTLYGDKLLHEVRNSTTICISGADGVSGESAVSYWLSISTPIHTGTNQEADIIINTLKKIGTDAETPDTNAYIRYSWDNGTTWVHEQNAPADGWAQLSTLTIAKEDVLSEDLLIQATHAPSANPLIIYESETITYAPLDKPILDLSNDSASITYYGNIKLSAEEVTSTATVYLGTDIIPATYHWALSNCTGSGLNTATITITGLTANEATATCTATTDLKDENGQIISLSKVFSLSKQLSAAQFWLKTSTPIHTGNLQKTNIVLSPMRKIADEEELIDTAAYLRYKWGVNGAFSNWLPVEFDLTDPDNPIALPFTITTANVQEYDLIVEVAHLSGASNYTVFDTETITYSPLNTPILDLTNDSDAIAYLNGDKINNADTVSSTATVYLNGQAVPAATINWSVVNSTCTISTSGNTVTVSALTENTAIARCTASNIPNYSGLTLTKDFTIVKQLKGEDGKSTVKLSITNDFDTIPCASDGTISNYDWEGQTTHSISVFEGTTAQPFKVYSYQPGNVSAYIVQYETSYVNFAGTTRDTESSSPYSAYITGLSADTGSVLYKLYKNGQVIDTVKFEASKLKAGLNGINGISATSYWLKVSTPVHTGDNQTADITVYAYAKTGNSAEAIDTTAIIEYKWDDPNSALDDSDPWITLYDHSQGIYDNIIPKNNSHYPNKDLIIQARHGNTVFETETITYSPLNTPVLDLTNDSDAIAYFADGSSPITSGDYVTSTATAYLNGAIINGAVYTWTLNNCTGNTYTLNGNQIVDNIGANALVGQNIKITGIAANETGGTATCTVSNIGYNGLTISKDFAITKQLQGRSIEGVGEYYLAWNSDDATSLPAFTAANIQEGGNTYTAGKWWNKIPSTNATNKYLWNIERLELSGGTYQNTDPAVISIWTKDGKGIASITNYYKVNNSTSAPAIDNTWTTTPDDVTATNRYLWNYEVITYTEGSPESTTPSIIGAYGQDAVDYNIVASDYQIKVPQSGTRNPQTLTFNFTEKAGQGSPTAFSGKYKIYIDDVLQTSDEDFAAQTQSSTVTINSTVINSINTKLKIELYAYLNNTWTMVENETIDTVIDGVDGQNGANGQNAVSYWLDVSTPIHTGALQTDNIVITAHKQVGTSTTVENDETVEFFISGISGQITNSSSNASPRISNNGATLTIRAAYIKTNYASTDIVITAKHSGTTYDTETITYSPLNTPVLDLSNDSDSIAYTVDGTKLGNDVSSTANVYLNGNILNDVSFTWTEVTVGSCTYSAPNNVVTVSALNNTSVVLRCTARFTSGSRFYGAADLVKDFTISKQLKGEDGDDGDDAISYWADLSSPIHTGTLQADTITVTPYYKIGLNGAITIDQDATFKVNNSVISNSTWIDDMRINNHCLEMRAGAFANADIEIKVYHNSILFDTETITYSPKNTPVLDLTNDSASIAYDGSSKIGSDVTSTAKIYLNGDEITASSYSWTLIDCTASGSTNNQTITINSLSANEAKATCSVYGITGYGTIDSTHPLTKVFTITKQLKGATGAAGQDTYNIAIRNDFVTIPATSSGNIGSILTPANANDNPTNHGILCYRGNEAISFTVSDTVPTTGSTGFTLVHTETNVTFNGTARTTASAAEYTASISAISADNGQILYSLYKGTALVAFAKFEATKLTAGASAISYRLVVSAPIHSGTNQTQDIVITPYLKIGDSDETIDNDAFIRYKWGPSGTWSDWEDIDIENDVENVTLEGDKKYWTNADLYIEAAHEDENSTKVVYEQEVITYSSPNAIVLDLDNDSDVIAYKPAPNSNSPLTPDANDNTKTADPVTSTASLYKGTVDYSEGAQFSWEAPSGYTLNTDYTVSADGRTITVYKLKADTAVFTCTAVAKGKAGAIAGLRNYILAPLFKAALRSFAGSTFRPNDLTQYVTITKTFVVAKQIGGEAATAYWLTVDNAQISKPADANAALTPSSITATFWAKSGTSPTVAYSGYYKYYRDSDTPEPNSATQAQSVTITTAGTEGKITIELYEDSARTKLLDKETIPVVSDGKAAILTRTLYKYTTTNSAPNNPAGVTTAAPVSAGTTISYGDWTDSPDLSNTIGKIYWACEETEFSDHSHYFSAVIRAPEINEITAIKEGKTTNFYGPNEPTNKNDGDCWFCTGYVESNPSTSARLDDYIGKYVNVNNTYTLVTESNKNSLNITAGTTVMYDHNILKQWNGSAWEDIGGELVANKVTATYINALKIKANAITVFEPSNNSIVFSANDADNNTANSVQIAGFTVNHNSIRTSGKQPGDENSIVLISGTNDSSTAIGSSDARNDWAITAGNTFGVTNNGKLYAVDGNFEGDINATSGTISGFNIASNSIVSDNTTISPTGITIQDNTNNNSINIIPSDSSGPAILISNSGYLADINKTTGFRFESIRAAETGQYRFTFTGQNVLRTYYTNYKYSITCTIDKYNSSTTTWISSALPQPVTFILYVKHHSEYVHMDSPITVTLPLGTSQYTFESNEYSYQQPWDGLYFQGENRTSAAHSRVIEQTLNTPGDGQVYSLGHILPRTSAQEAGIRLFTKANISPTNDSPQISWTVNNRKTDNYLPWATNENFSNLGYLNEFDTDSSSRTCGEYIGHFDGDTLSTIIPATSLGTWTPDTSEPTDIKFLIYGGDTSEPAGRTCYSGSAYGGWYAATASNGITYYCLASYMVNGHPIDEAIIYRAFFINNLDDYDDLYGYDYLRPVGYYKATGDATSVGLNLGSTEYRWNDIYSVNAISGSSDRTVKKDIIPLSENSFYDNFFDSLMPVSYKFKDNNSNRIHTGFIAQDIEDAIISNGKTTKDFAGIVIGDLEHKKDYFLRYSEFIALNTMQIQKLKTRVSELENTIAILAAEIAELKNK